MKTWQILLAGFVGSAFGWVVNRLLDKWFPNFLR